LRLIISPYAAERGRKVKKKRGKEGEVEEADSFSSLLLKIERFRTPLKERKEREEEGREGCPERASSITFSFRRSAIIFR